MTGRINDKKRQDGLKAIQVATDPGFSYEDTMRTREEYKARYKEAIGKLSKEGHFNTPYIQAKYPNRHPLEVIANERSDPKIAEIYKANEKTINSQAKGFLDLVHKHVGHALRVDIHSNRQVPFDEITNNLHQMARQHHLDTRWDKYK